jgi:glycosyltransferase involved in cell wall biosynthesis
VGDGDDLPRLRQLAHDCGVDGRVHFFSRVSRRELAACFAHADIFALPSTGEGFGMVFLEAMVFGRPIVGAACGGTTDVLEDGVNGLLVPPHDAGRLEQALLRLMRDEKLRAELGLGGARIVRQKYSFEVFRAELKQILAECGLALNLRS